MNTYIYDTNILLSDPQFSLLHYFSEVGESNVILIKSVFDELDNLKSKEDFIAFQSREASRSLEELLALSEKSKHGWQISNDCLLTVDEDTELKLPKNIHDKSCDDKLLAVAEKYCDSHGKDSIYLVTLDRNLRTRAEARDINWINPSGYLLVNDTCFFIPLAEQGFKWTAAGENSLRLPMKLENGDIITVDIWPGWGYASGQFSSLHFRILDPEDKSENIANSLSPLFILSTRQKLSYTSKLGNNPYQIIVPKLGETYKLIYKDQRLDITIIRIGIIDNIQEKRELQSSAMMNIGQGISSSGYLRGVLIGSGIRAMSTAAKNIPFFSQLGFSVKASIATAKDIKQSHDDQIAKVKSHKSKKTQNTALVLIVLAIVFSIPLFVAFFCMLLTLLPGSI